MEKLQPAIKTSQYIKIKIQIEKETPKDPKMTSSQLDIQQQQSKNNKNQPSNNNTNSNRDDNDDCEWDETKRTLTAWSIATKQRSKRTYGRRSSAVPIVQSSILNDANGTSSNASNSNARTYGRKRLLKPQQQQHQQQDHSKSLEHLGGTCTSTSSLERTSSESTSTTTTTKSQSLKSIHCNSIYEENLHPNLNLNPSKENNNNNNNNSSSQSYNQTYNFSNSFQLSQQDSLSFSVNSGAPCFSSICKRNTSSSSFFDDNGSTSASTSHINSATNNALHHSTTSIFDTDPFLSNSSHGQNHNIHPHPLSTPSRSVSSSSRKRGVCDSPLYHNCDFDSSSSAGGFSLSNSYHTLTATQQSSSSFGSSRRARSRIFSPESTKKIMQQAAARAAAAAVSGGWMNNTNSVNNDSDDRSNDNNNNHDDNDNNHNDHTHHDQKKTTIDHGKDMTCIRRKNESFHESESEMEIEGMEDPENSFFQNTSCEMSHADLEDLQRNESFIFRDTQNVYHSQQQQQNQQSCTMRNVRKKPLLPLPMMPRRMSSVGDVPFEEAIFAPVENPRNDFNNSNRMINNNTTNINNHNNHNNNNNDYKDNFNNPNVSPLRNNIFETMSSYEDLKFLVKELRRWSGGKLHASFGGMSKNCTVVPPNAWSSTRRAGFVEWMTIQLGFSHRCCGGNVNYLQIGASKAKELQKNLEKSLLEFKEKSRSRRKQQQKKKKNSRTNHIFADKKLDTINHETTPSLPMSSIKISRIE